MSVQITPADGGKIQVTSPYNSEFVGAAKQLGGRWNLRARVWQFDARDEQQVRDLLIKTYGTDGTATSDVASVLMHLNYRTSDVWREKRFEGLGRTLVSVYGRDSGAKLGEGVSVVSGRITSGGSRKNFCVEADENTVLRVRDVPLPLARRAAEENPDLYTIEEISVERQALLDEKARIELRLVEIDRLLEQTS